MSTFEINICWRENYGVLIFYLTSNWFNIIYVSIQLVSFTLFSPSVTLLRSLSSSPPLSLSLSLCLANWKYAIGGRLARVCNALIADAGAGPYNGVYGGSGSASPSSQHWHHRRVHLAPGGTRWTGTRGTRPSTPARHHLGVGLAYKRRHQFFV